MLYGVCGSSSAHLGIIFLQNIEQVVSEFVGAVVKRQSDLPRYRTPEDIGAVWNFSKERPRHTRRVRSRGRLVAVASGTEAYLAGWGFAGGLRGTAYRLFRHNHWSATGTLRAILAKKKNELARRGSNVPVKNNTNPRHTRRYSHLIRIVRPLVRLF